MFRLMLHASALAIGIVGMACGDDGGPTCGAGTHRDGTECVPDTTLTCGTGTHELDGSCIPDDPDSTAPGPVTNLAATVASGTVTLSWTNPTDADFESVLVVRRGSLAPTAAL